MRPLLLALCLVAALSATARAGEDNVCTGPTLLERMIERAVQAKVEPSEPITPLVCWAGLRWLGPGCQVEPGDSPSHTQASSWSIVMHAVVPVAPRLPEPDTHHLLHAASARLRLPPGHWPDLDRPPRA